MSRIVRAVSVEDVSGASVSTHFLMVGAVQACTPIEQARCFLQRSVRLVKNERKNACTITTSDSPLIARRSGLCREIDQQVAG